MRKVFRRLNDLSLSKGFTIVEIVVVISVIGILSTIGIISFKNIQQDTRNRQRLASATIIAEAIEKNYLKTGKYPSCDFFNDTANINKIGLIADEIYAPRADKTNGTPITCSPLVAGQSTDTFAYIVTSSQTGAWSLQYRVEPANSIATIKSRHTPSKFTIDTPVIAATSIDDASIEIKWTAPEQANLYEYIVYDNIACDNEVIRETVENNTSKMVSGLEPGKKYCFKVNAGMLDDSRKSEFSDPTYAITAPMAPATTVTTDASKIILTLAGTTCQATTAEYMVYSLTGTGSNFTEAGPWSTSTLVSTGITPLPGKTYKFKAKARCKDSGTPTIYSAESRFGDEGYSSPIPLYELRVIANPAGAATIPASGRYQEGQSVDISFATTQGYTLTSWSGAGCGYNITMPGNDLTCTANFGLSKPSIISLSQSFDQSTNLLKYNATSNCPAGTSSQYQRKTWFYPHEYWDIANQKNRYFTIGGNIDGEWFTIDWQDYINNTAFNLVFEGHDLLVSLQVKCVIGSLESVYSDRYDGSWRRAKVFPPALTSASATTVLNRATDENSIIFTTKRNNVNCMAGSIEWDYVFDLIIVTSVDVKIPKDVGYYYPDNLVQGGWYSTSHNNNYWVQNEFVAEEFNLTLSAFNQFGNITKIRSWTDSNNEIWNYDVNYKCKNIVTGELSTPIRLIDFLTPYKVP